MKTKRLSPWTLALKTVLAHKKKYISLLVGIILSMIFSSGILFFLSSALSSRNEFLRQAVGQQDMLVTFSGALPLDKYKSLGYLDDAGQGRVIALVLDKNGAELCPAAAMDEKARALYYPVFYEGRFPEASGEVALEKFILQALYPDAKIGDKITLTLSPSLPDDTSKDLVFPKEYTLVGVLNNKSRALDAMEVNDIPRVFMNTDEAPLSGSGEQYVYYLKGNVNRLRTAIREDEISRSYILDTTANALRNWGSFNDLENIRVSTIIFVFFAVVLTIASLTGVANAMNTVLSDRKKQIGLLRAVGATRRQIISVFGREAVVLSIFASLPTVFLSYFGVKIIISHAGERMIFKPDVLTLVLCICFSVLCIITASLFPLISASRISPMQAIRNIELMRKMRKKKIKSRLRFSPARLLSERSFSFSKFRFAAVSVILVLAVLFSGIGFGYLKTQEITSGDLPPDYNLSKWHLVMKDGGLNLTPYAFVGFSEEDLRTVASFPEVKSVSTAKIDVFAVNFEVEEYTDYYKILGRYSELRQDGRGFDQNVDTPEFTDLYYDLKAYLGYENELFSAPVSGYSDNYLLDRESRVVEGKIDLKALNAGTEILLFAPRKVGLYVEEHRHGSSGSISSAIETLAPDVSAKETERYAKVGDLPLHAGDTVELSLLMSAAGAWPDSVPADTVRRDNKVKIGAIIEIESGNMEFATTLHALEQYYGQADYSHFYIYLKEDCTEALDQEISGTLSEIAMRAGGSYASYFASVQNAKKDYRILSVGLLSIIILFFTLSASVISNSFGNQIRESKRLIGTLRAVGADTKELSKIYTNKMFVVFGFGFGVGLVLYLIFFAGQRVLYTMGRVFRLYPFTIWQAAVFAVVLIAVCWVNLRLKIRQQMKYSIVENIREL